MATGRCHCHLREMLFEIKSLLTAAFYGMLSKALSLWWPQVLLLLLLRRRRRL
jgi:hypothetical protein